MRFLVPALAVALVADPAASGVIEDVPQTLAQSAGAAGETPAAGAGPTPMPQTRPPGAAGLDPDRELRKRQDHNDKDDDGEEIDGSRATKRSRPPPEKPERLIWHPFLLFDDDDEDRIIVAPAPAEEREPETTVPVDPPPPPDPRGPKFVPARGAADGATYSVGEPLPEGVPFVTLDWSQYALPEPPARLVYARVGGDVVLLDPSSRVVERRVDPAELRSAEPSGDSG